MSRILQDQFIDEDEEDEVCPLCVEEFDLGDRYFKPCPCGYQICQFCYNNIKTTMNGLCPACRRPYDDKPFSFKNVTQEELLQWEKNKAAHAKKKVVAKQKEAQKREADNLSRKHLAGLRVRQRNLVYVTGIKPKIQGDRLVEALRGREFFGQYGDIIKIVVSKSKDAAHLPNQPIGIYVTFNRKEDAAACIEAINNQATDGKVRAQHGTTKYCSAYLRGESCNNRQCMFLHEPGESAESFTRQDLSSMNAASTQQPTAGSPPPPPPQHTQPMAAAAPETSPTSPTESTDASALPAGANWAQQARRASQAASSSVNSPVVTNAAPTAGQASKADTESKSRETTSESAPSRPTSTAPTSKPKAKPRKRPEPTVFSTILKIVATSNYEFKFVPTGLSEEDVKLIESLPPMWDPNGGAKRRAMKEREAEELKKQEEEAAAALAAGASEPPKPEAASEEQSEGRSGSYQLGGEPEEQPGRAFGGQSAIQPPAGFPLGQQSFLNQDPGNLGPRAGNAANTQLQSQLLLEQLRSNTSQHQQIGGHGRQNSRFGFNDAGGIKTGGGLQQPKGLAAGFGAQPQQVPFYSGVQGPPPGLKTTGTPPVNGSGMFGQGHGFTSGYGAGAGRDADRAQNARTQHELPALGQSLDPPRRATPTLPPGLFPQVPSNKGKAPAIESPKGYEPKAPAAEPKVEDLGAIEPPKDAPKQPKADANVVESIEEPASIDSAVTTPAKAPATPAKPVSRDPTPAEATAAKGKGKKQTQKKAPTPKEKPAPETPAKVAAKPTEESKPETPNEKEKEKENKSTPKEKAEGKATSKRPHPGKLNIDTTPSTTKETESQAPPSASSKPDYAGRLSRAPSVSGISLTSRPGTPLAGAVATGSPLKRTVQPRTLRITDTPKTETPPPIAESSAAASTPPPVPPIPALPSKIISRRTSIASLNPPGTPLTERTDTMSIASTSQSRASSPPPLATRKMTKSKEKRKKKEKATEMAEIIATAKQEQSEDVGPIMARKTKSKKNKGATSGPTPVTKPMPAPPPPIKEEKREEVAPQPPKPKIAPIVETPYDPTPAEAAAAKAPSKSKTKVTAPVPSTPPREDTRQENVPPFEAQKQQESPNALTAATILQALESTHQLAVSTLSLLKPLNSQSDLKKLGIDPFTSADLQNHIEQLRFELTKADEQLLKQGEEVRRDLAAEGTAGHGRISANAFVSPAGTRLSCLTKEEEDRYLELERNVRAEKGAARWGGAPVTAVGKQSLKARKGKLRNVVGQEDILRALNVAKESLEGALRDATKGLNPPPPEPSSKSTARQQGPYAVPPGPPPPAPRHPSEPSTDAVRYVNKFVPRLMDMNPASVAVPEAEDDWVDDTWLPPNTGPDWKDTKFPVHHKGQMLEVTPQLLADATAAAGLVPRSELGLPPPRVSSGSGVGGAGNVGTSAQAAAYAVNAAAEYAQQVGTLVGNALPPPPPGASNTGGSWSPADPAAWNAATGALSGLTEAMAITKLGASGATLTAGSLPSMSTGFDAAGLPASVELLKQWDRATRDGLSSLGAGTSTSSSAGASRPPSLPPKVEQMLSKAKKSGSNSSGMAIPSAAGAAAGYGEVQSMADLERESLKESLAEAKREAVEWEKRVNRLARGNRRAVVGS